MVECTVPEGETIAKGDAVCVIGFDTAENRPIVKRATRVNLANSKTVFGVAKDSKPNEEEKGKVFVLVAGEVADRPGGEARLDRDRGAGGPGALGGDVPDPVPVAAPGGAARSP